MFCFSKQALNPEDFHIPYFVNLDNPGRNAVSLLACNPAGEVINSPLPYMGCVTEIRAAQLEIRAYASLPTQHVSKRMQLM